MARNYLSILDAHRPLRATDAYRARRDPDAPTFQPAEFLMFDDARPVELLHALSTVEIAVQAGRRVAVYRRPQGDAWRTVPQILGTYACGCGGGARDERGGGETTITAGECSCPGCRKARAA